MSLNQSETKRCRQCLLRDMTDEDDFYRGVQRFRSLLSEEERTPDGEYEARLSKCRECASLENGTCRQCGCFVEMRAARIEMHCPRQDAAW